MIDWNRVEELRDEVGSDDFEEVVELFLEEVDEAITRMQTQPDDSRLEQDLHFLKGSSLNLGFAAFSTLCFEGETAARQGKTERIDLPKIFNSYAESRAEFLRRTAA
ncbi:Hpt domain-containing protein [Celeribacter sp. PS-C1]|uniref:Hpt domain-containing protein n=1 Tax=Celeribacter sp. PS-C1 TaxID=2820813 RepID=UPI001CA5AB21|nr:Hpt domain-containing protein [Celeribacter sp. PS-C1]MBW6416267.1 Hpt domain-containing protein [Celeribacter sp. PS-C1]